MSDDIFRNKLDFALTCSKHPKQNLTFSVKGSNVNASSAYEVNIGIMVHPCGLCQAEFEQFKWAVELIQKTKEEDSNNQHTPTL